MDKVINFSNTFLRGRGFSDVFECYGAPNYSTVVRPSIALENLEGKPIETINEYSWASDEWCFELNVIGDAILSRAEPAIGECAYCIFPNVYTSKVITDAENFIESLLGLNVYTITEAQYKDLLANPDKVTGNALANLLLSLEEGTKPSPKEIFTQSLDSILQTNTDCVGAILFLKVKNSARASLKFKPENVLKTLCKAHKNFRCASTPQEILIALTETMDSVRPDNPACLYSYDLSVYPELSNLGISLASTKPLVML